MKKTKQVAKPTGLEQARTYVSLYKDYVAPVCSNPGDAQNFMMFHRDVRPHGDVLWGPTCPVHRKDRKHEDPHAYWFEAREEFAKTGEDRFLQAMLMHVTLENPPER